MPIVRNPTRCHLYCEAADQEILAGDEIVVSDEVAARVSRVVFLVEETPSVKPTRKTATRGAKTVEVTEAPEVETR